MTDVRHLRAVYPTSDAARPDEGAIVRLAEAQHGLVAGRQLRAVGLGSGAIKHRVQSRRLQRVHQDVYALGHSKLTPRGRWMAAVLACGQGALLSHQSSFSLHGLPVPAPPRIHVTVAGFAHRHRGLHVHRVRWLSPLDRSSVDGIPVTAVPRTLLDLAEVLPVPQLRRGLAEAVRLRLTDVDAMWDLCQRSPGRRGLRPLGALLSEFRPPPRLRSTLERRFERLRSAAHLLEPAYNAVVAGFEVDVLWAEQRLIVELDTYTYHHTPGDFEADRARDAKLLVLGYRVLRVTDRQLDEDPDAVIATIRALLEEGYDLRPGDGPAEGRLLAGGQLVKL